MDKKGGGREYHNFLSKIFCLTVLKKFVGEPFRVSLIRVLKNFMLQRVMSRFLSKFFVSQCRKISQGNPSLLCFRKFPVAKKFMDKSGGEYQDFPSNFFCLTVPKIFVGEPLSISLISGVEKC